MNMDANLQKQRYESQKVSNSKYFLFYVRKTLMSNTAVKESADLNKTCDGETFLVSSFTSGNKLLSTFVSGS